MSQEATAPVVSPETPAVAPETVEAARPAVQAPEAKDTQQAETAILPPAANPPALPPTPTKPTHTSQSLQIEQNLATFIGDRLPAGMAEGLMVDVTLVGSNAVTSEGKPDMHDIAIAFKGGKLEDPAVAQELSQQLRAALREHPAFKDMTFGNPETKIEHMMRCSILALEKEHLQQLLTPQPRKQVTFIGQPLTPAAPQADAQPDTHICSGAGCTHHTQQHTAENTAPAAEQPKPTEEKAAVAPVAAPVTEVMTPALHQGMAANAPELLKRA